jgi:hypothetical protein
MPKKNVSDTWYTRQGRQSWEPCFSDPGGLFLVSLYMAAYATNNAEDRETESTYRKSRKILCCFTSVASQD